MKDIFRHEEERDDLIKRIKAELSEGILVSVEVVSNPKVYRFISEALESRGVQVPATVQDMIAGTFLAKRIIAAVWQDEEEKVKRDSS